jgi:hypothetical protein
MNRIIRPALAIPIALMVVACASGSPSAPAASVAQVASAAPTSSVAASTPAVTPSASPSAAPSPVPFTSNTYGYSLSIPADWHAIQATKSWDGKGAPFHDVPEADQFVGPAAASAWFFGAPTTKNLPDRVTESITANAAEHSSTCPPVPSIQDPIQIGSEPAVLLGYDCGILINSALAVHNGKAYLFGFRDPSVHAATDPTDPAQPRPVNEEPGTHRA